MRQCLTKSAEVGGKDEISNLPTHSAQDLGAKCEDLKEAAKIQTKKMPDTKPARKDSKHPFYTFPNFTEEIKPFLVIRIHPHVKALNAKNDDEDSDVDLTI